MAVCALNLLFAKSHDEGEGTIHPVVFFLPHAWELIVTQFHHMMLRWTLVPRVAFLLGFVFALRCSQCWNLPLCIHKGQNREGLFAADLLKTVFS